MKSLAIAVLLFACCLPAPRVLAQQPTQTIQCASTDGRVQRCPVDARGGVVLQTQYSRSGCYQNETWGYDANSVWVSNGCRAAFLVGTPPRSNSNNGKQVATIAAVALVAAAVLAASHKNNDNNQNWNQEPDAAGEYQRGCQAAQMGAPLPSYAGNSYRNGYMACWRRR